MSYKRQELLKPFVSTWLHLRFLVGSMLLIFLVFSVVVFCLFVFVLCLVYQMLPVSLGCPFLVAPSIISNVYLSFVEFTMRKLVLEIYKRLFYYARNVTLSKHISHYDPQSAFPITPPQSLSDQELLIRHMGKHWAVLRDQIQACVNIIKAILKINRFKLIC